MSFLSLDDKMGRHPKVGPLSDAAFRLHINALLHCSEYLTDGRIKSANVETLTRHKNKKELIDGELVPAGLWEPMVGGFEIHDYLDWNLSKAQVEARKESAKVRAATARGPTESAGNVARTSHVRRTPSEQSTNKQRTKVANSANVQENPPAPGRPREGIDLVSESSSEDVSVGNSELEPDREDLLVVDLSNDVTGNPARQPDENSPEAEHAAASAIFEKAQPAEETASTQAGRVFAEEWARHYREPYVFSPHTGTASESYRFLDAGRYAREVGGAKADEYLRHWARKFLRDSRDYYAKDRHPGRLWTIDAIRAVGNPVAPAPKAPSGPRKAAEPTAAPMAQSEHAARAEAIRAKLAGIGKPSPESSREMKAK